MKEIDILAPPSVDSAIEAIVKLLRQAPDLDDPDGRRRRGGGNFDSDLCVRDAMLAHLRESGLGRQPRPEEIPEAVAGAFLDAAWDLSRRGILRPGSVFSAGQMNPHASAGYYSLTAYGREWVAAYQGGLVVPADPSRFAALMQRFRHRFGQGFYARACEAHGCYRNLSYLACCAMAGAACESMLLAAAIARDGNEEHVLRVYQSSGGRMKMVEALAAGLHAGIAGPIRNSQALLAYWRDSAAHAIDKGIGEFEADEALLRLLRLAQVVDREWDAIRTTPRPARG